MNFVAKTEYSAIRVFSLRPVTSFTVEVSLLIGFEFIFIVLMLVNIHFSRYFPITTVLNSKIIRYSLIKKNEIINCLYQTRLINRETNEKQIFKRILASCKLKKGRLVYTEYT